MPPPPRKRNPENKPLPQGWRFRRGFYWYRVPKGLEHQWDGKQEFRLGRTLAAAYREWTGRVELHASEIRTIADLLERYEREIIAAKRPSTARMNREALPMLRAVFAHLPLEGIRPSYVYQYIDKRRNRKTGAPARTAARHEVEVLSHAYTKAVEWGLLDRHPFKGELRKPRPAPRDRYVTDAELIATLEMASPMLRAYLSLKLLTGLRRGDLLRLRWSDIRDDGIHVATSKTGRRVIYEWTDELHQAVALARSARRKIYGLTVFSTRTGAPYIREDGSANAWDSLWQRFMARVEAAGVARFTEHDLRAKVASDAESLERAREILAHTSSATTRRFYRRKPERVRPLR